MAASPPCWKIPALQQSTQKRKFTIGANLSIAAIYSEGAGARRIIRGFPLLEDLIVLPKRCALSTTLKPFLTQAKIWHSVKNSRSHVEIGNPGASHDRMQAQSLLSEFGD
jgi:hypothetical protein